MSKYAKKFLTDVRISANKLHPTSLWINGTLAGKIERTCSVDPKPDTPTKLNMSNPIIDKF